MAPSPGVGQCGGGGGGDWLGEGRRVTVGENRWSSLWDTKQGQEKGAPGQAGGAPGDDGRGQGTRSEKGYQLRSDHCGVVAVAMQEG